MNKTDVLIALLYAPDRHNREAAGVDGITRLEKLLFLSEKEGGLSVGEGGRYKFVAFRMGPWSSDVYDEIDFLESLGLVESRTIRHSDPSDRAHDDELLSSAILDKYDTSSTNPEDHSEHYRLTDKGRKKALEIWENLPAEEKQKLIKIKQKFNSMNLRQLLRYVYQKYPEYTSESEIKDYLGIKE